MTWDNFHPRNGREHPQIGRRARSQVPRRGFTETEQLGPPKSKAVTEEMVRLRKEEIKKLQNPNVQYLSEVERHGDNRVVTPTKKSNVIVEKPNITRYD